MTKGFTSSLRFRLILLALLSVLPALGMIVYFTWQHHGQAKREAQQQALVIAKAASNVTDDLIVAIRNILFTLAQIPQLQQREVQNCELIFANLMKTSDRYSAIIAFTLDGQAFASAQPLEKAINVSDRDWYRRLLETQDFVISEHLYGRLTGYPVIVFGHPVFDRAGRLAAVVMISLKLDWLRRFIAQSNLPPGSALTMVDQQGTILARYPELPELVGEKTAESSVIQAMLTEREGVLEARGPDGVERFYGFTSLGKGGRVYVSVGLSKERF